MSPVDQDGADLGPAHSGAEESRPGSRLARMRQPLARHVVEAVAVEEGACIRPVALRRVDLDTGETTIIPAPCGATLASKCLPCAARDAIHLPNQVATPAGIPAVSPLQDASRRVPVSSCQPLSYDSEQPSTTYSAHCLQSLSVYKK
ncbi:hypothetical protein FRACA_330002 [Frankia canadensis]|uniref:Uncharacterized protein n=1 Tax=Frankia canadensis TaxID=1836972 RepID=A0A2I2KUR4_9ACTN|nr:hypothetical protein FRACA_330002 [Frankia canadensis]SOU56689.1 hypothetical protein FRACA_330002 [Frankia canadensis]